MSDGDSNTEVSLVTQLPELAMGEGIHEGAVWTVEMSGKGLGAAQGSMDSKGGRAVILWSNLVAELPTHHLERSK